MTVQNLYRVNEYLILKKKTSNNLDLCNSRANKNDIHDFLLLHNSMTFFKHRKDDQFCTHTFFMVVFVQTKLSLKTQIIPIFRLLLE